MSLIEHRSEGLIRILWVREDAIAIESGEIERSFLLLPSRLEPDWGPTDVSEIDAAAIDKILGLEPELVLLGTGRRQIFPSQRILAEFLRRQIGVEVMDNAAAARTYQLLAEEGRRVLAAFVLPGESSTIAPAQSGPLPAAG